MNASFGLAEYFPKEPHGTNPAATHSVRAGTNASSAPVSRLTLRTEASDRVCIDFNSAQDASPHDFVLPVHAPKMSTRVFFVV